MMTMTRIAAVCALLACTTLFNGNAMAAQSLTDHCNLNIRYLFARQQIRFTPGSSKLRGDALTLVDTVAEIAAGCPDAAIRIEGHTDSLGSENYNIRLSAKRAGSVAAALVARGVSETRLDVAGLGSARPIADNATSDGRASNRRIEIRFIAAAG